MTPFRMPAEWEPQSTIWLSWPHNQETWPENLVDAQQEFADFTLLIAETQPVKVMADKSFHAQAKNLLESSNVELIDIPTNDAWARDYAPTFVKDETTDRLVAIDWHYNAWGGKYPPFEDDQKVARRVAEYLGIEPVSLEFCFEGGAIDVNSQRVLLSTTTCALNTNRNHGISASDAEAIFAKCLGTKNVLWLHHESIPGDDTDGHIDQMARFVNDETIVYSSCLPEAEGYVAMQKNLDELRRQIEECGMGETRLVGLPNPEPVARFGRMIPASYCNFLITNDLVIVPQFGFGNDQQALEILKPFFPNREVIGLPTINLAVGLGSFHCLSQQQPV